MTIDTKRAPRRALKFTCLGCLRGELNRIEAAHRAGTLKQTGNWTPGQILDHCAVSFEWGLDGANVTAPWPMRALGMLVKGKMTRPGTMRPGFNAPKSMERLMPRPDVSFDEGLRRLRRVLERIAAGEKMTQRNPWLGGMTHQQWVGLNLNHSQMHLGFLTWDEGK